MVQIFKFVDNKTYGRWRYHGFRAWFSLMGQNRIRALRKQALQRGRDATLTKVDIVRAVDYFKGKCPYCWIRLCPDVDPETNQPYQNTMTVDHYLPGGDFSRHNILPCCYACNNHKNNTPPWEWTVARFGYRKAVIIYDDIMTYFVWVRAFDR